MNPTGEGLYLFRTVYVNEIHNWLEYSADNIKKNSTRLQSNDRVGRTSGARGGRTSGKRYMYYLYKVITIQHSFNQPDLNNDK